MTDNSHSREAERALLGTLSLHGLTPEVRQQLHASDFHEIPHRRIYAAMCDLLDAGEAITEDTLHYRQQDCTEYREAGGFNLLTLLLTDAQPNLNGQMRSILDLSRERWALRTAERVAKASKDPAELSKVLADASAHLTKRWGQPVDVVSTLWSAAALCDLELPDSPWLLPGLIVEGGLNLIAGEVAAGKTWLALDLGLAAASGGMAWGRKFTASTPTLYLGCDNNWSTLARRVKDLVAGREIPGPADFHVCDAALDLGSTEGLLTLERLVTEMGARLVVIDVLARYMRGVDENAAGEVAPVLTGLRAFANRHGVTLVLLHHLNKSKGIIGQLLERIRGSIEFAGAVDTVLVLTVQGEGMDAKRMLRQKKNRDGEEAEPASFEILPGVQGGLCLAFDTAAADVTVTAEVKVRQFLANNPGSSKRQIIRGTHLGTNAALATINRLVDAGQIRMTVGTHRADLCSLSCNDRYRGVCYPLKGGERNNTRHGGYG